MFVCLYFCNTLEQNSTEKNLFPRIYIFYTQTRLHSYIHTYYTYIQSYIHTNTCHFIWFSVYYKKQFDILLLCILCYTVRARSLLKSMHFLLVVSRLCVCKWLRVCASEHPIGFGPHQNVSDEAQTSCRSKQNTSISKSNQFWVVTRLPNGSNSNLNQPLRIICKYCLTQVLLCPCLVYCTEFLARPFLSSSCPTFFFFCCWLFHISSALSPVSLVRLVPTYCVSILSSHSLLQQSLSVWGSRVHDVIFHISRSNLASWNLVCVQLHPTFSSESLLASRLTQSGYIVGRGGGVGVWDRIPWLIIEVFISCFCQFFFWSYDFRWSQQQQWSPPPPPRPSPAIGQRRAWRQTVSSPRQVRPSVLAVPGLSLW